VHFVVCFNKSALREWRYEASFAERLMVQASFAERLMVQASFAERLMVQASFAERLMVQASFAERLMVQASFAERLSHKHRHSRRLGFTWMESHLYGYITCCLNRVRMKYYFSLLLCLAAAKLSAQENLEGFITPPLRAPSIHALYGFSTLGLRDTQTPFSDPFTVEVTVGIRRFLETPYAAPNQLDYAHPFLIGSFQTSAPGVARDTITRRSTSIGLTAFRFGFGTKDGLGYRISELVLTPYLSSGIYWTNLLFSGDSLRLQDLDKIRRFSGDIKYGTFTEAGLVMDVGTRFALDFSYGTSLIYPKYIFLQSVSNLILQQTAHSLMRVIIKKLFLGVPAVIPIVSFVMKSAFNFVLYHQRLTNMNFPFSGEPAIGINTFKIGIILTL
jgi:hypothetical protein